MEWILVDLKSVILSKEESHLDKWIREHNHIASRGAHRLQSISEKALMRHSRDYPAISIINKRLRSNIPEHGLHKKGAHSSIEINKRVMPIIRSWKKKHKVALISDTSRQSLERAKDLEILKLFDNSVVSCSTHHKKHEKEYYSYIAKQLGCKMSDMLLIDGSKKNIMAARMAGVPVVLFRSSKDIKNIKIKSV